ncbi:pyridoxamine 5'-phosphate oxidase [Mycobacterium sp. MAA66]|uniref:pyridoxamine 5'-phosphate oxidase n=1 Tax=Mycobacterium sp. MAA66 TaxID=3156297 RepID=UPI003512B383
MAQWAEVDGGRAFLRSLPVLTGTAPEFDADAADPVALFRRWMQHAVDAGVPEPHAMTISTVDAQGLPRARVLILKAVDNAGWHFAVNTVSQKGHDLNANPVAALTFYWPSLVRQVRVVGPVVNDGAAESAADFLARPVGSRAMALTRRQSQPLTDLSELETEYQKAQSELETEPRLVPDEWVSYAVRPVEIEFWQGAKDRRHVRLAYRRIDDEWEISRLWP